VNVRLHFFLLKSAGLYSNNRSVSKRCALLTARAGSAF
jgi:hypothetical protein